MAGINPDFSSRDNQRLTVAFYTNNWDGTRPTAVTEESISGLGDFDEISGSFEIDEDGGELFVSFQDPSGKYTFGHWPLIFQPVIMPLTN